MSSRRAAEQGQFLDHESALDAEVEVLAEGLLSRTDCRRSLLVAARKRTSTLMGSFEPRRVISRSCRTRSSFACMVRGMSPISSRKSVPPSAYSKRPSRSPRASVKALRGRGRRVRLRGWIR